MIITIARQCGCGALHVGEILSKELGLKLYTRQTLMELAKEKGMLEEMHNFFEEDPVDDLMDAITSFTEEHEEIRRRFTKSFYNIIGDENCIVIGRCGNHIFKQRNDLFSFFLHGDRKKRIENIAMEKHISLTEAEEFVDDIDDRRISYHRYYTGLTWGNAADYDMCLDTCKLGTQKTAQLMKELVNGLSIQ